MKNALKSFTLLYYKQRGLVTKKKYKKCIEASCKDTSFTRHLSAAKNASGLRLPSMESRAAFKVCDWIAVVWTSLENVSSTVRITPSYLKLIGIIFC